MKKAKQIRNFLLVILDWFYEPFYKIIPLPIHTFRYAACGGANTLFDIFLYFIFYNFVLNKENLDLHYIVFSPHIAAFILSFMITFPTGFLLNKYISFLQSEMKGRIQLFRYGVVFVANILLNYFLLKLLVETVGLFPTPSKIITTGVAILFSYLLQKNYTFR